jgi:tripartite ATP-independent transporter DctM subunit
MDDNREHKALRAASGKSFRTGILEDMLIASTLLAMALLPVVEFSSRKLLGSGIPGAIDYLRHGTLLLGFVAAVAATRDDRNLKIASISAFIPVRFQSCARLFAAFIAIMSCSALAWSGILLVLAEAPSAPDFIKNAMPERWFGFWDERLLFSDGGMAKVGGWIPVWVAESLIPLGFIGVIIRMIQREGRKFTERLFLVAAIPATAILAVLFKDNPELVLVPGIGLLVICAIFGLPIFALLGGTAALLFWSDGVTTAAIPAETYRIVTSEVFPSIPIFTLIGFILSESGASRRLERFFAAWFGWMPGGIAVAVTFLCAFFATFTGASGVSILALGSLLLPILINRGFNESFSIGLLTSTGSIGLLLPPSLVVILYAVIAQVPIVEMFKASMVPGIIMILPVIGCCIFTARRLNVRHDAFDVKIALQSLRYAAGEITLPVIVLGLLFMGWCSPVEAAAFGAVYALVVESLVYRDLGIRKIYRLLVNGGIMVGGILVVLGVAMGLTSYLIDAGIPMQAAEWVKAHVHSRWMFLLAINSALILVGCFMDIFSALIVIVPLLLPMAAAFGVDPVHLGVIFMANLQLGYLTPPVGMNLYLASFRFERPLMKIARDVFPFLVLNTVSVIIITYVPALTLWAVER